LLQTLKSSQLPGDVIAYLESKPEAHAFLASRLLALHPQSTSEAVIFRKNGAVEGVTYIGTNLIPSFSSRQALFMTSDYLKSKPIKFSSIVGESTVVYPLWELIEASSPAMRLIRPSQPVLSIREDPLIASDPLVRPARADELELVIAAGVTMFIGEVGEAPHVNDFRARAIELISLERTYIRREGDQLLFKADIGAVGAGALQIHGVWVPPAYRGQGIGSHGMASVLRLSKRFAPIASLYVNDFNHVARASYKKVGFVEVGTFTSIFL
jgi:predicted GNAT family acetyltransferase